MSRYICPQCKSELIEERETEDHRQWFNCPKEGCGGRFWRPHPDEVDYLVEVMQCPKCGILWRLMGGELAQFERWY